MDTTASATRGGSSASGGKGFPFLTAQKAQLRVQVLPRMRNVAVRADQHSEILGHLALWQIVCRLPFFRRSANWKKLL
jgi:hypothetical protein